MGVVLLMRRLQKPSTGTILTLPILPEDLWFAVLGMILRRWWSAPRAPLYYMPTIPDLNMI